jgi:IS30 family transposase
MTADQKQQIQQMRQKGLSYLRIASALNIPENTIKSHCRRNNLGTFNRAKLQTAREIQTSCKHCSKPLTRRKKGQPKKFCSEECRRAWWKANDSQLMKKAYYTLICQRPMISCHSLR